MTALINGLDWLIGQKCVFSESNGYGYREFTSLLARVDDTNAIANPYVSSDGKGWSNCRLVQGEKTTYDGKGQPVPDGVTVKIWYDADQYPVSVGYILSTSEIPWDIVTHYQVEEQSVVQLVREFLI